ncbi:MAG: YraN family protein [Desulfovibrionales bacterium]
MASGHLKRGELGETAAADYLRRKRYRILDRNWSCRQGELDIVCDLKGTIVFVEVKTRDSEGMVGPVESLNAKKQERVARAAAQYLSTYQLWDRPCRFDLMVVLCTGDRVTLEHIINAFDWSETLGRGNAPWQPW